MNHRRMIRYRRHRGYGASALSFVTACWNGLWKETLFSVSSVSSVVSFAVVLVFSFVLPLCPPQSFFRRNAAENEGLFELPL